MTFSISARCEHSGMFGVAVSSSSPAVAARCAHARAGVGAVASQNVTDPRLGPRALDLMQGGASAKEALDDLVATQLHIQYRQLALVDASGRTAAFSGANTLGVNAVAHGGEGRTVVAAGNLLADASIPRAMVDAYLGDDGPFGLRLIGALQAAVAAGGEAGPVRSAGLLVVRDVAWPVADLRVDWDDDPVATLERLWAIYAPQLEDYVRRALDPASAPRFGVPGDMDAR